MSSHPGNAGSRGSKRWHIAFWPIAFVAAIGTWFALDRAAGALYPDDVSWQGHRFDIIDEAVGRALARGRVGERASIVFFGDSTVASYEQGLALPALTAKQIGRLAREPKVKMINASAPGAGILQYAFLADRVAAYEPDLVIWQLSFFQFTDRWTARNGPPELVGFVDGDRLPEILSMPIEVFRLSLADLLLHQAIVQIGLHDLHGSVRTSQLRFAHLVELAEDRLNPNRGRKPEARARTMRGQGYLVRHVLPNSRPPRYSAYGERIHFETTLEGLDEDHAKLALLGSGIRALTESGTDVLVYLNPTNIEHLRELGILNTVGLQRTIDLIRAAVATSGGHFLDLHDLLGDAEFRDPPGHFVEDETQTVPRRVALPIAEAAREILLRRRASAASDQRAGSS